MAEEEEKNEGVEETPEQTPAEEAAPEAAAEEAAPEAAPEPEAPAEPEPALTPKERRAAVRAEAPAPEADHAPEHGPGRPKVRQGVVISAKPDKTISVRIDVARRHRRYRKILRTSTTLHAHDERNDAHEGDTVRIVECRPLSRSKRWRLVEILERAR